MEHRWGSRFESGIAAGLRPDDGLLTVQGVVRNVSLSGAYVETAMPAVVFSRLYVRPLSDTAHWMAAYIVRADERGVAVEWVHPGMAAVRSWLPLRAWQQVEPEEDAVRNLQAGTR